MELTLLMKYLGDTPQLRIINFFVDNKSDYSKKEILEGTGMSKTTLYKIWSDLEDLQVVSPVRKYGNTTLYKLNHDNIMVKQVMSMDSALGKMVWKRYLKCQILLNTK